MPRLDQYGRRVPVPLGVLTCGAEALDTEQVNAVLALPWYLGGGVCGLLVPLRRPFPVEDGVEPVRLHRHKRLYRVAEALKRWNPADGFYHA